VSAAKKLGPRKAFSMDLMLLPSSFLSAMMAMTMTMTMTPDPSHHVIIAVSNPTQPNPTQRQ
jgi:hypothetical protein